MYFLIHSKQNIDSSAFESSQPVDLEVLIYIEAFLFIYNMKKYITFVLYIKLLLN